MTGSSTPQIKPLAAPVKMPERVTQALLALIRSGEYPPKARLPSEADMAQQFGVSRTVIREAVSRLKSEGLVESRQGLGVFVREVGPDAPFRISPDVIGSVQQILEVAELRRCVESEIAALAAERATKEQARAIGACLKAIDADVAKGGDGVDADIQFHRSIARATGNPHFLALWDFLSQFLKGSIKVTRAWEARKEETRKQVEEEHRAVYEAILRRDAEAARTAARQHMEMSSHRIRSIDAASLGLEETAPLASPARKAASKASKPRAATPAGRK